MLSLQRGVELNQSIHLPHLMLLDSINLIGKCRGHLELYLIILDLLHIVLPLYMKES
jgi:hypothetical protein